MAFQTLRDRGKFAGRGSHGHPNNLAKSRGLMLHHAALVQVWLDN